jgi:hypothetical protein
MIELYLDKDGNLHGEDESVLNPENLDYMETILKAQEKAKQQEDEEVRLRKKFLFNK